MIGVQVLVVVTGGVIVLMVAFLIWQARGTATRTELHREIGKVNDKFDTKFEKHRVEQEGKLDGIYQRLNTVAQAATETQATVQAQSRGQERLISLLTDRERRER